MLMRGFVTIATGNEKYYKMAANLLRSYRKWVSDDTPFAIICDRQSSDTQEFDEVVLMEQASCSYMDKLLLYRYTPYDETIFIDADSLILSDPSGIWEDFSDADAVSCYGCRHPLDSDRAWFTYDGCGEYKEAVKYLVDLHGGVYYLRKGDRCRTIFEKAIELAEHYEEYSFNNFNQPADEPVLALALAIHQSVPCEKAARVLFVPSYWGQLSVTVSGNLLVSGREHDVEILHFATENTKRFIYRYLADLNCRNKGTIVRYLRMKCLSFPTELKVMVWHNAGQILRRLVPTSSVTKIKDFLRR